MGEWRGQSLSENIAIESLRRGMLAGKDTDSIKERIKKFTDPELTMSHGRAVTIEDCNACGLNIDVIEPDSDLWKTIWHLYMRSKYVVDQAGAVKLLDTCENNFTLTA